MRVRAFRNARASWLEGALIGGLTVLVACDGDPTAEQGRELISTYGCASCHRIPGAIGQQGLVGPPLDGWRMRRYIAGRVLNTPEALVEWIMDPHNISPRTAMPDLGVTETEARAMAAYLFTLD